jgi:hypothetical protein
VVLGRQGQVGTTYCAPREAQSVERLGRGHLVDQVEIDEEKVGLTIGAPHHVLVPYFFRQGFTHIRILSASFHILNASSRGA